MIQKSISDYREENNIQSFPLGDGLVLSGLSKLYVLNATAAYLWGDLNKGLTLEQANYKQAQRFGMLPADLLVDSKSIFEQWLSEGLISNASCPSIANDESGDYSAFDVRLRPEFALATFAPKIRRYRISEVMITCSFENSELANLIHPAMTHLEREKIVSDNTAIELGMENGAIVVGCDGKEPLTTFDLREARANVLIHILDCIYGRSDWCALLHAAALARNGRAFIFTGACRAGKTTLAAHLLKRGWEYLSEDLTAIDVQKGFAHGLPLALSLKRGSWDLMATDFPEIDSLKTYKKFGTSIRYLPPPLSDISPLSIGALFAVNFNPAVRPACRRLSSLEAMEALVSSESWINPVPDYLSFFIRLLETIPVYQLTYQSLDQARCLLEEIIP